MACTFPDSEPVQIELAGLISGLRWGEACDATTQLYRELLRVRFGSDEVLCDGSLPIRISRAAVSAVGVVGSTLVTRALRPLNLYGAYQAIVDLDDRQVVAYEALARWRDADLSPDIVFPAAAASGQLAALDGACRRAAIQGALDAGMAKGQMLFINAEPATFETDSSEEAAALLERASTELRIMIELTERSLSGNPSEVLRIVRWARAHGRGTLAPLAAHPAQLRDVLLALSIR